MSTNFKRRAQPRSAFGGRRNTSRTGSRQSGRRTGQYIDPARFVKTARLVEAEEYTPENQFEDFLVHELLKRNLVSKGYQTPSPIQDKTIPLALTGKDVIGIANTGTGKTAAFALPILHRLLEDERAQALIVAPTRELAQQIESEMKSIAKGSGLYGALLIGGTSMQPQLRDLRGRPRIIIGTPGRIKDHLERGTLVLDNCSLVVLDEVDRMLDMGFLPDMTTIMQCLPAERQSLFFSATMDPTVRNLIDRFARDAVVVKHVTGDTSDSVHQDVVRVSSGGEKIDKLHDILIAENVEKVIVFDETQRGVERLSNELVSRGFNADSIHGGKTQGQRQRALQRFKASEITILVATDVAARGIDVKDITHVINYTVPQSYSDYIHRIGRAGRAGRIGHALTFVS